MKWIILGLLWGAVRLADAEVRWEDRNAGFVIGSSRFETRPQSQFDAMRDYGASLTKYYIRLNRCQGCEYYDFDKVARARLEETIIASNAANLRVVVTVDLGGDERSVLWGNERLQESFIANWVDIAEISKKHPNVAGLDLLNEPVPPAGSWADKQQQWRDLFLKAAKAIRSKDGNSVLIYQVSPDARPDAFDGLELFDLKNVIYSIHFYFPTKLTHQFVMDKYKEVLSYPSDEIDRFALRASLKKARDFQLRTGAKIYVGEFSCVRTAPGGSATQYIKDSVSLFKEYGWSWTYHEFRGFPLWDAELTSDSGDKRRSKDAPTIKVLQDALQ